MIQLNNVMDIEGKRKLAIDILEDEMSEYTSEYLDGVDYLKDWIIEAMFRFNKEVNNSVLDDVMPRELTAENGAKALLIGEFHEVIDVACSNCDGEGCELCEEEGEYQVKVPISWTNIKDIYKMIVKKYVA